MSTRVQVATRVLKDIEEGRDVSSADEMYLRFIARTEEVTLPVSEIARRILGRENEHPMRSKAAV